MSRNSLSEKLKNVVRQQDGGVTIIAVGVAFVILVFTLVFLELITMYDVQYAVETRAQRAVNTTVEYAMDDAYRGDWENRMDVAKAKRVLLSNLRRDLNVDSAGYCRENGEVIYRVSFGSASYVDYTNGTSSPNIQIKIYVTMPSNLGKTFGMSQFNWTTTVKSQNFRENDPLI